MWLAGAAVSSAEPPAPWLGDDTIAGRLQAQVSVAWTEAPLRQSLRNLAQAQRLAIVLDRRVDPGRPLSYSATAPLEAILLGIAQDQQLGLSRLASVIYLGPPKSAARLRTLAALRRQEIDALPSRQKAIFLDKRNWSWKSLTTPQELLSELEQGGGIPIRGRQRVPHDLWPAYDLPPLTWIDRLTLVLVQFDLTFTLAEKGSAVDLAPIGGELALRREYRMSAAGARRLEKRLAAEAPTASVRATASGLEVVGRVEDLDLVQSLLAGGSPRPRAVSGPSSHMPGRGERVHKLTVKNVPIERLLEELSKRLELDLEIDREAIQRANISLSTPVAVSIQQATLDELLERVLSQASLTFERRGSAVRIFAVGGTERGPENKDRGTKDAASKQPPEGATSGQ